MVKSLKKAFTISKLVIVFAVIAILAAALILTFTSLIQKTNQSNDTPNQSNDAPNQSNDAPHMRNMNTLLAAAEATDGKPDTMSEAIEVIKEGGYDLEKLTPTGEGYDIVWDQDANRLFMIGEDGKLIGEGEANEITEHLWTVISEAPAQDGAYSVYLLDGFVGPITHSAGVDVGSNADIDVTISMESNAQKDIIVRTNGGNLIVNAGISDVGHYGAAQTAAVQSVGENSYHEYGTVGALTLNKGRAVLEQSVANVTVEPAAGQSAKLEVGQNAEVVQLTVNATAGTVQLKNSGTIKNFNTTDENLTVEGNAPESTATYTPVTFTTTVVEGGLEISGVEGKVPASIREIGEEGFYGCENLGLLVLECNTMGSEKNSSIGARAFYGCTALEEIRVGQYVSQVEYCDGNVLNPAYFGNASSLQKLTVDERNEYLYAEGNCIIEKATKTLVLGCKASVIPADVVKIGSYAFYGKGLTSLNIPESVTAIGIYAFAGGNTIKTLRILETVRTIGMNAFDSCGIETLVFDPTVSFGIFTFSGNEFKTIYCLGTQEEWNALCSKINAGSSVGNEILTSSGIAVYYYSETRPEAGREGNYWHYDETDGITPVLWETQA
mgnify:CR=1 FL=1